MQRGLRQGSASAGAPGDVLQRLVWFIASALVVRFAFVKALRAPRAGEAPASVDVWLARDYGLRFAFGRLERSEGERLKSLVSLAASELERWSAVA